MEGQHLRKLLNNKLSFGRVTNPPKLESINSRKIAKRYNLLKKVVFLQRKRKRAFYFIYLKN